MTGRARAHVYALALVLCLASVSAPAQAGGGQCWRVILQEWTTTGDVSTRHEIQCYDAAVANAPDDVLIYSSFEGDVLSAKRRAVRSQAGGAPAESPRPASPSGETRPSQSDAAADPPPAGGGKPEPGAEAEPAEGRDSEALAGVASGHPPTDSPVRPDAGETGGDEPAQAAAGEPPVGPGATPARSESAEVVGSGSTPVALIGLVVAAALLSLGGGAALILRRRGTREAEESHA